MIKIEKPMLNREVEGRCGLDDPAQLAERIGRLQSLYMTALNNYVEGLRAAFGDVPNFNWNSFECCHCRSDGTTALRLLPQLAIW